MCILVFSRVASKRICFLASGHRYNGGYWLDMFWARHMKKRSPSVLSIPHPPPKKKKKKINKKESAWQRACVRTAFRARSFASFIEALLRRQESIGVFLEREINKGCHVLSSALIKFTFVRREFDKLRIFLSVCTTSLCTLSHLYNRW